jgi:hypothetical protein
MAAAMPASDGIIATFLSLADLSAFDAAFQIEGVIKTGHIVDITKEDLVKIGKVLNLQLLIFLI